MSLTNGLYVKCRNQRARFASSSALFFERVIMLRVDLGNKFALV